MSEVFLLAERIVQEQTIAAISTPMGTGGIGIVRLSGERAIDVAERIFRPYHRNRKLRNIAGYSGALGRLYDEYGDIDDCIAHVYIAPKSYTGEDIVELSCHGGMWVLQRVLRLCLDNGASPAAPGEFTKRAFLNGKLDLSQAEAVQEIINAKGEAAMKAALSARDGSLTKEIMKIAGILTANSAHLAAWADYPDEEIEEVTTDELLSSLEKAADKLQSLLTTYDRGKIIYEGIHTAIVGKPNVGKSTLMNLLSGHERSIVTELPGTTRDVLEDTVRVGELVLRLYDTAGIRETQDRIELIGVEKSKNVMDRAQLILAVFDSSRELDDGDLELLALIKDKPCIAIINKIDLPKMLELEQISGITSDVVTVSAVTGEGREALEKSILKNVGMDSYDLGAPMVGNERQRALVIKALDSLQSAAAALKSGITFDAVNVEIDDSLAALVSITGERVTEKVIDEVFSCFCVGK